MYQKLIEQTIKTVVNQFHRKPFIFFNEHGFHQYCYHIFYGKKEFSKLFETEDGKKTNLMHPEYPTIKRFVRKSIKLFDKGTRASYDMVILNPDFIKRNKLVTVVNRNIAEADHSDDNLIAAMEFKFITTKSKNFIHELKWDFFKLKKAREVQLKYMLVFSTTKENEKEIISLIRSFDSSVKVVYARIDKDDSKKRLVVVQNPDGWLNS